MTEKAQAELDQWLVDQGLGGSDLLALISGYAERLVALGVPVRRLMYGSDLLHPTLGGQGVLWERDGRREIQSYARKPDPDRNPDWLNSPFYPLITERLGEMRRRIALDYRRSEFPLLDRLQDEGFTDYIAFLVDYGAEAMLGEEDGIAGSVATDAPGGFAPEHLAILRRFNRRLALAHKTISTIGTARTLMKTYLGSDAAARVLSGSIGRGTAEMISAAIWYSDLEGFTRLADSLSHDRLIPFLNAYAECFVEAIHGHGGQVLKFVGDGILAIFPQDGSATGCDQALAAAVTAQRESDRLFRRRSAEGEPVSRCFIGLHVGEVLYGNVGSADRLDFTVLGPAVNETSRIERLCRSLEQGIILSEPFAAALGIEQRARIVSLGRYALRGVGRAQELFTLDPALAR